MPTDPPGAANCIKPFQIMIASEIQMQAISFEGWCYNFSYVQIEIKTAISEIADRKAMIMYKPKSGVGTSKWLRSSLLSLYYYY